MSRYLKVGSGRFVDHHHNVVSNVDASMHTNPRLVKMPSDQPTHLPDVEDIQHRISEGQCSS